MAQGKLQPTLHLVPEEAVYSLLPPPGFSILECVLRRVLTEVVDASLLHERSYSLAFAARHGGLLLAPVLPSALFATLFVAAFVTAHDLGVLCHDDSPWWANKIAPTFFIR